MVTDGQWEVYKNLINGVASSFNKEVVEWGRAEFKKDPYGESTEQGFTFVNLEALLGFNTFRTWPITDHTEAGELDNQNMFMMLNRKYLSDNGWLTPQGYFNFDPASDIFKHRGIQYKSDGDTLASQAKDDPLHLYLILVRQEINTGTDQYDQG